MEVHVCCVSAFGCEQDGYLIGDLRWYSEEINSPEYNVFGSKPIDILGL
ncbi:hypothetical protein J2T61_000867 [Methanocalculus sp. AMF5]|nr:hypothetical protein [Methanocalculus sp. AMF5]